MMKTRSKSNAAVIKDEKRPGGGPTASEIAASITKLLVGNQTQEKFPPIIL